MKKLVIAILIVFAAIFVAGCDPYNVEIVTFKDPQFVNMRYAQVMVCVNNNDLIIKKTFENEIKFNLQKYGVRSITDSEMFPPTRSYSESERLQALKHDGYDAYLVLAIDDYKVDKNNVAPTSQVTTGQVTQNGNNTNYVQQTQLVGGYTETNMNVTYSAKLFDVATNKVAWMGTMKMATDMEYYTNRQILASETGKMLINRMVTDNVLAATMPQK
ncbi:MAG: hypothetical protein WCV63_00245 [Negativicutes bacterium]|jgi:hypothetical protein